MKNLSLMIVASSISLLSCAQNIQQSQVPAVALNTFQALYPKAVDVEWERKGKDHEVEFETGLNRFDHKILIDSTGKVIFHKQDISKSDLPQDIIHSLDTEFINCKIDDVEKIEENGKTTYKMEVKRAGEEWKLLYDESGKRLQKVAD